MSDREDIYRKLATDNRAEIERLREALERISKWTVIADPGGADMTVKIREYARAALNRAPERGEHTSASGVADWLGEDGLRMGADPERNYESPRADAWRRRPKPDPERGE